MGKGMKHYTEDGEEWGGGTHKMDDGTLHTGKTHDKKSRKLVHKKGPFKMKSPLYGKAKGMDGKACWKGYSLRGTKMKGGQRVDNCVEN